jgi:hypothetical protein
MMPIALDMGFTRLVKAVDPLRAVAVADLAATRGSLLVELFDIACQHR